MVIYFSGTGNSRYAAEVTASETGAEIRDAGVYIKEGKRGDFSSQSPWVFVSPTYCGSCRESLRNLSESPDSQGRGMLILSLHAERRRVMQEKKLPLSVKKRDFITKG